MSYSDPKYATRQFNLVAQAQSWGTTTAAGTAAIALTGVAARLPKFVKRTKLNAFQLQCSTIPNAASTALTGLLMNGTNTVGTVVLTTATAGQVLTGVVTSTANAVYAADAQVTFNLIGTATASGSANGAYDVWLETQELFQSGVA
jgi:hypothetical protein